MAGKEECACSSCLETTKYTFLRCERLKKKNLYLMCTRTSNRQKLQSNTGYINGEAPRLLRTKSSKTTFEENITLFKQRLRYRGYLDKLIYKTLSEVNFSEKISALQNKPKKSAKTFCRHGISPFCAQPKTIQMSKWHLIENQPLLREIYKDASLLSYRKERSLKDVLVRAN